MSARAAVIAASLRAVPVAAAPVRRRRRAVSCDCACHQLPTLAVESVVVVKRGVRRELDPLAWASYLDPLPGSPDPLWRAFLRGIRHAFSI